MKVFNKGQVVIPAEIRKQLGITPGDPLDVTVDPASGTVVLRKAAASEAKTLAGSLARYAEGKGFPSRADARRAIAKGLVDGEAPD